MMSGANTDGAYNSNFVEARRKSLMSGPANAAYASQKQDQEKRKSVMSLFEEMKNFNE